MYEQLGQRLIPIYPKNFKTQYRQGASIYR